MRTLQSQAVVWGFITILAASCTDTDFHTGKPGDVPYPTLHTTLLFTSGDSPATRGAVSSRQETVDIWFGDADSSVRLQGDRPDTRAGKADAAQADDVQNVCVFQVNPTDGKLMHSEYHDTGIQTSPERDKSIDIALCTDMATCELYVLANVGDLTDGFSIGTSTRDDIQSLVVDRTEAQQSEILNGNAAPLSGIARDISLTDIPLAVPVQMQRTVAQIDLNLTHDGNFKFHAATLHNVPRTMNLFESADTTAADTYSLRYFPVKSDNAGAPITATWYMPENKRGSGSVPAGNWEQRNEDHAPVGSSFLQISGLYHDGTASEDVEVVYIVLIGSAGDANDFNVKRNTRYTLNISINSCDTVADGRIIRVIDLSEPGTANCYLTNKTHWWYKLKGTVRGNGAATDAEISPTGQSLAQNAKIAPQAVGLLWETVGHRQIIQQLEWPGNGNEYVYFKTGHYKEGNAVVFVKDGTEENSKILWSWHIWHNELSLEEMQTHYKTYLTAPRTISGYAQLQPRTLRVMDRNLGAFTSEVVEDEVERTFGLAWQWGRKDPFVNAEDRNRTMETRYDASGKVLEQADWRAKQVNASTAGSTIANSLTYSIENPDRYIVPNGNIWISAISKSQAEHDAVARIWGTRLGDSGLLLDFMYEGKTIYDPCPTGWCVAPADTWLRFTTSPGYGTGNAGYFNSPDASGATFNQYYGRWYYIDDQRQDTDFYSYAGLMRNGGLGASYSAHQTSCLWGSSLNDSPFSLCHGESVVFPITFQTQAAGGFCVRCVREEDVLANKHLEPAP